MIIKQNENAIDKQTKQDQFLERVFINNFLFLFYSLSKLNIFKSFEIVANTSSTSNNSLCNNLENTSINKKTSTTNTNNNLKRKFHFDYS